MAQVKITISKEGDVSIAVNGVAGESCKDLTKNIERAIGTVTSDIPTKEMHDTEVNNAISNRA